MSALDRRLLRECLVAAAAVVVVHLLLRGSALFLVGAFNDDGAYVALGKAISDGIGYRLPYLVGAPVAVKYPPGLPVLLAIPWTLGGSLAAVRATVTVLNPLVCGVAGAVIWWIGRRDLALSPAPLGVFALGPLLLDSAIQYYNIPLAEPYFLLGWAIALAFAATVTSPRGAVALGLVLAATAFFRSAGLVLILACLAALALRRVPWRVVAIAGATAFAPLIVWGVVHGRMVAQGPLSSSPDEVSYWSLIPFGPAELPAYVVRAAWNNGRAYVSELSGALAGPVVVGHILVLGTLVLAVVGATRSWRRAPALALTVAVSLAVVLVWPFFQLRLLLPLLPFAGLLAAAAFEESTIRLPARLRLAVPIGLVLVALTVGLRQVAVRRMAAAGFINSRPPAPRDMSPLFILAVNSRHLVLLSQWARANTTPQDRLLVDFPAGTYLHTARVTAPASPDEGEYATSVFQRPGHYLAARILEDSVTVVAIGIRGAMLRDIETVTGACPAVLHREIPGVEVYRVVRDEACLRRLQ